MGVTLATVRVGVLGLVGDVDELVATATSADASTFVDDENLYKESGTLIGRFLLFDQDAANPGALRRIQSNDKTTSTVVLNRALDMVVQSGDRAIMINYRDQGLSKAKVDRAINDAIRAVQKDYLLPTVVTNSTNFTADSPTIDLTGVVAISGIDVRESNGVWTELPLMDWRSGADRWTNSVSLEGVSAYLAEGLGGTVRVRGYSFAPLLVNDLDETMVDYEWLVNQAASNVFFELARRRMDPQNNERWGQYRQDLADERRSKVELPAAGYVFRFFDE